MKCKHCANNECLAHCQRSDDGKHIPANNRSAGIVFAYGGVIVAEFYCEKCDIMGTIPLDAKDIRWGR